VLVLLFAAVAWRISRTITGSPNSSAARSPSGD
jgi:hypothetical protein